MRKDAWRRFGALASVSKDADDIRKEITQMALWNSFPIDSTIRSETTKDIINDIFLYREAAIVKVRAAINKRDTSQEEKKRLYTLLKQHRWLDDPFLHRQMRKHFRHGISHTDNQFKVRSDKHSESIVGGKLTITIKNSAGKPIVLTVNSNGKNVSLEKVSLRIIVRNGKCEIHYYSSKKEGRICGVGEIGLDKGYTEAFADSAGNFHGQNFGKVLTQYSDTVSKTGKQRNKLHALEKRHRAAGRIDKANAILKNNLGRIKLTARKEKAQQQLRDIAFKSVHRIVDLAQTVVAEDLSSPFSKKNERWKRYNRRMSMWAKGVLAQSLNEVCKQRGAKLVLVNAAYTSQMDSQTRRLEGRRDGDKFCCVSGDVLSADTNAACNVLHRKDDKNISLYTPYKEVRRILLARFPTELTVIRHQLGASVNDVRNNLND